MDAQTLRCTIVHYLARYARDKRYGINCSTARLEDAKALLPLLFAQESIEDGTCPETDKLSCVIEKAKTVEVTPCEQGRTIGCRVTLVDITDRQPCPSITLISI